MFLRICPHSLARRSANGLVGLALVFTLATAPAAAREEAKREGVDVGETSRLARLVPAEAVERQAAAQYQQLLQQAAVQRALAPLTHPQLKRLRAMAERMIPHANRFNPRASQWQWEVNLIGSQQINAFCMPGGKIVFYTGILDKLKLTDDEAAMVMGHEIAHALREHARERIAKTQATRVGAAILGQLFAEGRYASLFAEGGNLLTLKFSRDDETEADVVGLELAARAGYDPRAGVTLWQKMSAAARGTPLQWLSTHPSGENRIKEIEKQLPLVLPLFQKAPRAPLSGK
jgi:Zn-dependent protease with chaperone function